MTMRDYDQLKAAHDAALERKETIAVEIADRIANNDNTIRQLVSQYRIACLAVESAAKDMRECWTVECELTSLEE